MIQAHELHIGNYFINPEGQIEQCFGTMNWMDKALINPLADWSMETYDGYKPEDCNGVVLIPEILKDCGFTFKDDRLWRKDIATGRFSVINQIILQQVDKCDKYIFTLRNADTIMYCRDISALHELQNLFYALTGQELEVNLPANQTT